MSRIIATIGRKILSLALIFNSIISLVSAANILIVLYTSNSGWQPYSPYLIDGSFFWFIILTAILNIVPAKLIGRVNIKRVFFHHYVYGFLTSSISFLLLATFMPAYLFLLLTPSLGLQTGGSQTIFAYTGLFFIYGGLTLVIDDLYDISTWMGRTLDWLKIKIIRLGKAFQALHLCSSIMSIYIAACGVLWYLNNSLYIRIWPLWDIFHVVIISSLLVTSFWGLKAVREKLWFMKLFTESLQNRILSPNNIILK